MEYFSAIKQKFYDTWKKLVTKGHISYYSLCIKYPDVKSRDAKIILEVTMHWGKGIMGSESLKGMGFPLGVIKMVRH